LWKNNSIVGNSGLIAHAERTSRHFSTGSSSPEHRVVALLDKLLHIHFGRRHNPELCRCGSSSPEHLSKCAEMTDIGHAASHKHLVNLFQAEE